MVKKSINLVVFVLSFLLSFLSCNNTKEPVKSEDKPADTVIVITPDSFIVKDTVVTDIKLK